MKFLVVVTPPSIYQFTNPGRRRRVCGYGSIATQGICVSAYKSRELISRRDANPILDKIVYKAVLSGGEGVELYTNRVAESILTLCDSEGNEFIMFREILVHRSDDKSTSKEDA